MKELRIHDKLVKVKNQIYLTLKESEVAKNEFNKFISGLQKDINSAIDFDAGVDMLACHIICKPVFESLFEDNKFIANNSVSKLMEVVLKSLEIENPILRKTDYLKNYNSAIYEKLKSVKSFKDKQTYIKNFYGEFIKASQEKEAEKHGIVYTPIEVIDFIINSVEDVLKKEFNLSLDDKGVHILDPFSGTGTFITRLLQSGILKNNLVYKYQNEIFANEILLFSYYVASINIESSMVEELKDKEKITEYLEFNGMVLTDTFNMNENDVEEKGNDRFKVAGLDDFEFDNSEKIAEQKKKAIKVIIGNPPYSVGQKSENDNNKNIKYKELDASIKNSYVKDSLATKTKVYDSYIRAIKWSSNRLAKEESGIVAFIVNSGFIKAKGMDGLRKHLAMDYDKIYMLDLKGNSRNLGEAKLEGGNIFDIRAGVVIIILVKGGKENKAGGKQILYANIGDGLKKEEKFERLKSLKGISGIKGYLEDGVDNLLEGVFFKQITPNNKYDWLEQRLLDEEYNNFMLLGDKTNKNAKTIFGVYSLGVATARDAWVYNFSKKNLQNNMEKTIEFYNMEVDRLEEIIKRDGSTDVENFVNNDGTKISWTRGLKNSLDKKKKLEFKEEDILFGIYRPFIKEYLYFNKDWNEMQYQLNKMLPNGSGSNILFGIGGESKGLSSFITDEIVNYDCVSKAQYFSLYSYVEVDNGFLDEIGEEEVKYKRVENVTDFALKHFREYFKTTKITKEEIFYYCFGMLNNEKYLAKYKNYLSKEMVRVPLVENEELFFEVASLGKKLADIILNYENYNHNKDLIVEIDDVKVDELFKVNKMKFLNKELKDTIIYNDYIRIKNIPKEAYNYIINGKSGINWIMDRYSIKQDKDSGIINDPNLFAKENLDDKYILNLLLSVISLSIDVVKIKTEIENLVRI